jgi:membrane fusion protein, macrolide-specific efflux system
MFRRLITWFFKLPLWAKIGGLLLVGGIVWLVVSRLSPHSAAPQYQTAQVQRGTLISSVSASGSVSSGNSIDITTSATGEVSAVYVKNGDKVVAGQKIADLILDQTGQQKQLSAWSAYLSAKNQLSTAQNNIYSLQAAEFAANQKFINDAVARNLSTSDPTYIQENAAWLQSQASYQNQPSVIEQSQISVSSAWLSYQQTSAAITAPSTGTISNLILAPGLPVTSSAASSTGTNAASSQVVGNIIPASGQTLVMVNISEIDSVKIKPGQRVTLTLDAYPDKTFTGKVMLINTSGSVSSNVTTYPATIALTDTSGVNIYPNMAVDAKIITDIQPDVLLVPSAAVQTTNGQTQVRVLRNGQPVSVAVEVGPANDTETEIVSGINEGDTVVTGVITSTTTGSPSTGTSPFGGLNRGGGGGAVRIIGR